MSQEHVDVVRQAWRAYAEGGLEAELAFHAPDAVYEDLPEMADRASYRGPEGFIERNRQWRESWEEFHSWPLEFIDAGDGFVLVPVATTLRGKGSRVPIESGHTWAYEVRDGKIVGDRAFRTKAEALEAFGLRE